ncbi:G-protein coupled receptor, putative [Plasmodium ovale]|uniref:G-protein coupled receptor n=2 Tax=Plasmodium ovale TaxID=36330 RepID=A0A1A8WM67_PLAOA|nr:G-protein coupled receptor [Plasmodium ovale curtisi]SBS92402.1 G-protein coupled receptor [Plasmodium ovale curtisi]SCQ16411.1 G-protein coupled receptor, putative [Plasmodium ovale]
MGNGKRYIPNDILNEFEENDNNIILIKRKINEYGFKLNSEIEKHSNKSIYCGLCGIIYMDIILYECNDDYTYLELGNNIIKTLCNYKNKNGISFLEGITGIYSISSIVHYYLGNSKSMNSSLESLIKHLKENKEELRSVNSECELLYGKCGYLYSLLFCRNIWLKSKYKNAILKNVYIIMCSIFDYGLVNGSTMWDITSLTLYFEWHRHIYLGAAHGYAGIFLILFKLIIFFLNNLRDLSIALITSGSNKNIYDINEDDIEKCKNSTLVKIMEYFQLIYKGTDEILNQYITDEFNVYSSVKKEKTHKKNDSLVQWCHGNIGFVILLIELLKCKDAPSYFKNKYNKQYVENMGFLIWEKGLLCKGLGLCHGISGNGIVFLYLYNFTNDKNWYIKALKYALFSIKYFDKFYNVPDRPNSLFEGYAGLVVFLCFVLKPHLTYFPAYDLPPC